MCDSCLFFASRARELCYRAPFASKYSNSIPTRKCYCRQVARLNLGLAFMRSAVFVTSSTFVFTESCLPCGGPDMIL